MALTPRSTLVLVAGMCLAACAVAIADELEMYDGRKFVGQVISQDGGQVQFRIIYPGGGSVEVVLPRVDIRTIKIAPLPKDDPPKVVAPPKIDPPKVTPRTVGEPPESEEPEEQPAISSLPPPATQPVISGPRTATDLNAVIEQAGRTPPDWWDSQPANFPKTLDTSWPEKPGGGWDPNRNPGQYFIEAVNRGGATRAKEAAKAAHYIIAEAKNNKPAQFKAMCRLGQIYGVLLHDYARGAFWYRKAAAIGRIQANDATNFAYCYWKLGAKAQAIAELNKPGFTTQSVRMLGQMGDVARALQIVKNGPADYGNLVAGDVLRHAGRYKEAASFYSKAAAAQGKNQKVRDLARASADAMPAFAKANPKSIADGAYQGESAGGYRGPIKVEVSIKAGRIETVRVTGSSEDWPMNAKESIPAQIVEKQSLVGIDVVTGATWTSGAIINAVGKALGDAAK